MEIDRLIRSEWHDSHALCPTSLAWLRTHADAGDRHPITTALEQLRADERAG
jgi:hypothetical protein